MAINVTEDFRQSFVVMRNEIKKFFSGKRMLIYLALLGIILFVITFVPYILGSSLPEDAAMLATTYISMSSLIVLMGSTLFASISIVSEYEERTALIVFTRPISKFSIFFGKFLACIVTSIGFIAFYYVFGMIVSLVIAGSVDVAFVQSFLLACAYALGTTGIAMAISSVMKKASTSTILTFVALLIIIPALTMVFGIAGFETTWMIDQASASILSCSEGYRDMTNEMLDQFAMAMMSPDTFINIQALVDAMNANTIGLTINPELTYEMMKGFLSQEGVLSSAAFGQMMSEIYVEAPDVNYDAAVMCIWGVIGLIASFLFFRKREF